MTPPETVGKARASGPLYQNIFTLLALGTIIVFSFRVVLPAIRGDTNGFAAYYTASYLLVHAPGEFYRVYDDAWFRSQLPRVGIYGVQDIFNVQPPTMALLLLLLAGFSPGAARLVWILFSLLFLFVGVTLLIQRLGLPRRWRLWTFSLCLLYAPIAENLENGQAYLLLFCLLCIVVGALAQPVSEHASSWSVRPGAGVALGLMLVLKAGAAWLWPLLLFRRHYGLLLWAATIVAAIALLSIAWFGPEPWRSYEVALPRLATEPWRYVTAYQTTTSLFGHLTVYNARRNPLPALRCPWLAQGLTLAVLLISLICSVSWAGINAAQQGKSALTPALFGALIVANSPLGEGYHYTLVLPSIIIACWWASREKLSRQALAILILAVLLLGAPLPYMSHRLEEGWWALFAYPRVYGAYLLWLWLGWAIRRRTLPGFDFGIQKPI